MLCGNLISFQMCPHILECLKQMCNIQISLGRKHFMSASSIKLFPHKHFQITSQEALKVLNSVSLP